VVLRAAEEFGPYLVYEQLGIGGMATVHRAETTGIAGFRRPVALKRMLPHVAANDDLVRSFVREARLASHLRHANVAQTYDLGKVGDIYFIAMELVLGRTLRDILRLCSKTGERIPIPIALNILSQVCDALDYAHNLTDDSGQDLGIIHRDVSPSNVIVAEGGVVKLIDFGIAKASAAGMQTMSGTIKGKFGYMAPEYLAGKIDARADLFALGVIAHELLTGRPLFQGRDDMDTLFRVKQMTIESPRKWNPEIPEEIDSIVMTALDRDPDARWQRAAAMRVALTTETKHLGLAILDQQVVGWVERIFEEALGDVGTPAPTRVLGTSPSISAAEDSVVAVPVVATEAVEARDVSGVGATHVTLGGFESKPRGGHVEPGGGVPYRRGHQVPDLDRRGERVGQCEGGVAGLTEQERQPLAGDAGIAAGADQLGLHLAQLHRSEECVGAGGESVGYHRFGLAYVGLAGGGGGLEGAHLFPGEYGTEIGASYIDAGCFAGPAGAGLRGGGGARGDRAAEPGISVEDRKFGHHAAAPVGRWRGVVEARGVEGSGGDTALLEGESESGQRIISPHVASLGPHGGEDPLEGSGGLGTLRTGVAAGGPIGIGGGIGSPERFAQ